jgi:hypothetical protein
MYYTQFKRIIKKVNDIECGDVFMPYKTNESAWIIHSGGKSILNGVRHDFSCFVFKTRQLGIQDSTRMVRPEASRLLPEFRDKLMEAKSCLPFREIDRAFPSFSNPHRQKNFQETKDESPDFIALVKEKVASVDPDDILNMDQTPIPFSYHSTRTLEKKVSKTINVWSLTTNTKQVTLAVALPPMLIFKGAPNGRIVNHEFVMFPKGGH